MTKFDRAYEKYEELGGELSRSKFYKFYVKQRMDIEEIIEKEG